jgi:hypothetical protein
MYGFIYYSRGGIYLYAFTLCSTRVALVHVLVNNLFILNISFQKIKYWAM